MKYTITKKENDQSITCPLIVTCEKAVKDNFKLHFRMLSRFFINYMANDNIMSDVLSEYLHMETEILKLLNKDVDKKHHLVVIANAIIKLSGLIGYLDNDEIVIRYLYVVDNYLIKYKIDFF